MPFEATPMWCMAKKQIVRQLFFPSAEYTYSFPPMGALSITTFPSDALTSMFRFDTLSNLGSYIHVKSVLGINYHVAISRDDSSFRNSYATAFLWNFHASKVARHHPLPIFFSQYWCYLLDKCLVYFQQQYLRIGRKHNSLVVEEANSSITSILWLSKRLHHT